MMKSSEHRDFKLTYRKRGDLLFFQVSGDVDSQAVRIAYWQEIAAITRTLGLRKLLVLDRKKYQPATPKELAELAGIMHGHRDVADKVAVVEPTTEFVTAVEHAEIEGLEQGINIRVFGNIQDAEHWLMYGLSEQA